MRKIIFEPKEGQLVTFPLAKTSRIALELDEMPILDVSIKLLIDEESILMFLKKVIVDKWWNSIYFGPSDTTYNYDGHRIRLKKRTDFHQVLAFYKVSHIFLFTNKKDQSKRIMIPAGYPYELFV